MLKRKRCTLEESTSPSKRQRVSCCNCALDDYLLAEVLHHLDLAQLFSISLVNKQFHRVVFSYGSVWKHIVLTDYYLQKPKLVQLLVQKQIVKHICKLEISLFMPDASVLAHFANITQLTCSRWSVALDLAQHAPRLKTLIVKGAPKQPSNAVQPHLTLPQLEHVHISLSNASSLHIISAAAPNLRELRIFCSFGIQDVLQTGLDAILQHCTNLKLLELANTMLSSSICDSIAQHANHLETVIFSSVFAHSPMQNLVLCSALRRYECYTADQYAPSSIATLYGPHLQTLVMPCVPSVLILQAIGEMCHELQSIRFGTDSCSLQSVYMEREHVNALLPCTSQLHSLTLPLHAYALNDLLQAHVFSNLTSLSLNVMQFIPFSEQPPFDAQVQFPSLTKLQLLGSLSSDLFKYLLQSFVHVQQLVLGHVTLQVLDHIALYCTHLQQLHIFKLLSTMENTSTEAAYNSIQLHYCNRPLHIHIEYEMLSLLEHVAFATAFEQSSMTIAQGPIYQSLIALSDEHRQLHMLCLQLQVLSHIVQGMDTLERTYRMDGIKEMLQNKS